ncbi:tungstate transporter permease, partial [bacterium]
MDMIWTGIVKAVNMLISLDPEIYAIAWLTVKIT